MSTFEIDLPISGGNLEITPNTTDWSYCGNNHYIMMFSQNSPLQYRMAVMVEYTNINNPPNLGTARLVHVPDEPTRNYVVGLNDTHAIAFYLKNTDSPLEAQVLNINGLNIEENEAQTLSIPSANPTNQMWFYKINETRIRWIFTDRNNFTQIKNIDLNPSTGNLTVVDVASALSPISDVHVAPIPGTSNFFECIITTTLNQSHIRVVNNIGNVVSNIAASFAGDTSRFAEWLNYYPVDETRGVILNNISDNSGEVEHITNYTFPPSSISYAYGVDTMSMGISLDPSHTMALNDNLDAIIYRNIDPTLGDISPPTNFAGGVPLRLDDTTFNSIWPNEKKLKRFKYHKINNSTYIIFFISEENSENKFAYKIIHQPIE